jgi:hypothetical protein
MAVREYTLDFFMWISKACPMFKEWKPDTLKDFREASSEAEMEDIEKHQTKRMSDF